MALKWITAYRDFILTPGIPMGAYNYRIYSVIDRLMARNKQYQQ